MKSGWLRMNLYQLAIPRPFRNLLLHRDNRCGICLSVVVVVAQCVVRVGLYVWLGLVCMYG